jgi:N-acetylmuramoyl-L-alanine amidase
VRTIDAIVVHCSDSPDDRDVGVREIRRWHTEQPPAGNGWSDVAYHYIVRRNGEVELGRFESEIGAHVNGRNSKTIGVCWVGRDKPTEEQLDKLEALVVELAYRYELGVHQVFGHSEAVRTGKTCPNLDMVAFRTSVSAQLARRYQ